MAGVAFACRTLQHMIYRKDWRSPRRLRAIVARIASELAIHRWLEKERIPYSLRYEEPFTLRDHPTLLLGGHRVEVCCTLLSSRHRIRQLRRKPAWFLDAEALVPIKTLIAEKLEEGDLLLFVLFLGLQAHTQAAIRKVISTGQHTYLLAIPPHRNWYKPTGSLGKLTILCDDPQPIKLELVGQLKPQRNHTEQLTLSSGSTTSALERAALHYLHSDCLPNRAMCLRSPELEEKWVIEPHAWINLWIYGMEVILTGWCTKRSFLHRSRLLPAGTHTRYSHRIQTVNRSMSIQQLRPMKELIERIRQG